MAHIWSPSENSHINLTRTKLQNFAELASLVDINVSYNDIEEEFAWVGFQVDGVKITLGLF